MHLKSQVVSQRYQRGEQHKLVTRELTIGTIVVSRSHGFGRLRVSNRGSQNRGCRGKNDESVDLHDVCLEIVTIAAKMGMGDLECDV
jgi:hypothetical protein